jgi:DNA-binding CsgD family transcriptional regulator
MSAAQHAKILQLHEQGLSLRRIGERLKISAMTAQRVLTKAPEAL